MTISATEKSQFKNSKNILARNMAGENKIELFKNKEITIIPINKPK